MTKQNSIQLEKAPTFADSSIHRSKQGGKENKSLSAQQWESIHGRRWEAPLKPLLLLPSSCEETFQCNDTDPFPDRDGWWLLDTTPSAFGPRFLMPGVRASLLLLVKPSSLFLTSYI